MVQLVLKKEMFENNRYTFSYGNREALFKIIDEEFAGHNRLGRLNRMNITVRKFTQTGKEVSTELCSTIIAIGDSNVLIRCDDPAMRSKLLNKDNMEQCTVVLYEDGDT